MELGEPERQELRPPSFSTWPAPAFGFKTGGFEQHSGPDIVSFHRRLISQQYYCPSLRRSGDEGTQKRGEATVVTTRGGGGAAVERDHSHFDIGVDLRIGWFVSRDREEKEAEKEREMA